MYSVPSEPSVIPCGSPGRDHRRTTFESRVGAGVSADCAWREIAADKVSSTIAAVRSLLECVGEVFDNRIREKLLTHLTQLPLDFRSWLPTIRKRYTEQLADPHIFHTGESERAEGVLNRFSLRVEDRGLQLDDDGGFHALFHTRGEDLLHQTTRRATRRGFLVAAAVGPDRMGDATEGDEAFIVSLLVAIVDRAAGEDSIAVVLVRADCGNASIRSERRAAVAGPRQIRVGHIARSGSVVARVVEGDVDHA